MSKEKTMTLAEAMDLLGKMFKGEPWFYEVGQDQFGRPVVYCEYMCHETLYDVPDSIGGHQVLTHFAASIKARKDDFVNGPPAKEDNIPIPLTKPSNIPIPLTREIIDVTDSAELIEEDEDKSLRHLINELDKLEKQCGSNILQDIFYEVHDQKNAVTNLSVKFPEVRERVEKLYKMYGFDVIYEELDG